MKHDNTPHAAAPHDKTQFHRLGDHPTCDIPACENKVQPILCANYTLNDNDATIMSFRHCRRCRDIIRNTKQ